MHQAAAKYWNEIAASQLLRTEWAQQMFRLPQEDLDLALENEGKRLIQERNNPALAGAYLKIMPLLWESAAISGYLKHKPNLRAAIPPIESIAEATMIASNNFRLTTPELRELAQMLKEPPMPNKALSMADLIINDCSVSAGKRQRYRDRAETPRYAEALFRPSFEAETLLRVTADSNSTTIELTSAEGFVGLPFTHENVVAPSCASRFWTKLDELLAARFNFEHNIGFDGTTIKVDCRTPACQKHFEVWCPTPTSDAGMLIGLIYDIALEASTAPAAIRCLENLRGHLRAGS